MKCETYILLITEFKFSVSLPINKGNYFDPIVTHWSKACHVAKYDFQ